jgi:hypothetical protein
VSAAELAVMGGAAGVGAVVGALVSSAHVSLGRQHLAVRCPAPPVIVLERPLVRLLPPGRDIAGGGRALCLVRGRPYDWARDGEAVGA